MTYQQLRPMTAFPKDPEAILDANKRIYQHLTDAMEEFNRIQFEGDYTASRALSEAIRSLVFHTKAIEDYVKRKSGDTDEAQACGHSWDNRKYDVSGLPVCVLCDLEARLAVAEDELSRVSPHALTPKVQRLT